MKHPKLLAGNDVHKVVGKYVRDDGSIGTWSFPLDHFLFDTLYARKIFQVDNPSQLAVTEKLEILNRRSNDIYLLRENVNNQPKGGKKHASPTSQVSFKA